MAQDPIYQSTDYDQGDEGGTMAFLVSWQDAPNGSQVSFHAMTDPAGGPVTLPLSTITASSGTMGVVQQVQAGYRTQIITVFFPSAPVGPSFQLALRVQFETSPA